jgi:hypothetical protein
MDSKPSKPNKQDVLQIIYDALRQSPSKEIDDVTIDGDNRTSSVLLTLGVGEDRTQWIFSSEDIGEIPFEEIFP